MAAREEGNDYQRLTKKDCSTLCSHVVSHRRLEAMDDNIQSVHIISDTLKRKILEREKQTDMNTGISDKGSNMGFTAAVENSDEETVEIDTPLSRDQTKETGSKIIEVETENDKDLRNYDEACDRVKDFYREQHEKQTVAYNLMARVTFKTKVRARLTIWDALIKLNELIDESDPDTEMSQIDHSLQTAEAIRRNGKPRWMQLTGLIHDLGKLLYFFDAQGQWDVVGDTFPVGCRFDHRIIYPNTFEANPDSDHPVYSTEFGIYSKGCGLDNVMLSWGHDEYMYHIAKRQSKLPLEALAMIRYHSFYPWHKEGAYYDLMNENDKKMLKAVQEFNPYDLYSKMDELCDVEKLAPYYKELIDEYFPSKVIDF
ncbi:DUF706-domain-containing protein [Nadsonia fulvescens var. elongata DSM 6958]|uniref:Inositol oxygenase n=1 Tax=Nadsonia fulvescens var. elongata DSM 6958 TaxID=857566 RepID=A0A1E3PEK0_9ASCO|nr:DUF706-domain-containing protein [Nadsonia fulvescens var. elongata DSM 6958]